MIRESIWVTLDPVQDNTTTANTANLISVANAALLALRPFTVVRTHGAVLLDSDQVIATEQQEIAYAHAVVSEQASTIGVTAVPTPIADGNSGLFWVHEYMFSRFTFVSGVGIDAQAGRLFKYDSKAMRRVDQGQDIITVMETAAGSEGVQVTSAWRMLIKLH